MSSSGTDGTTATASSIIQHLNEGVGQVQAAIDDHE